MKKFIPFLLFILPIYGEEYIAKITHYCKCKICCGKSSEDGIATNNKPAIPGKTLALPREFPFGTKVYYDGGKLLGECGDRGGAIVKNGNTIKIDVFCKSHEEARKKGVIIAKVHVKRP